MTTQAPESELSDAINNGNLSQSVVKIAESAESVAGVLSSNQNSARDGLITVLWKKTKSFFVYTSIAFGSAFAIEQYLAGLYFTEKARIENLLTNASSNIGSDDHIVRANSLRTLVRISEFSTYTLSREPEDIFQHIRALFFGFVPDYPYFEQSWTIFNDIAKSSRKSEHHLVSSVLLEQGAHWEKRIKSGETIPAHWNKGSVFFRAHLNNAVASDLDVSELNFSSANLKGSNLSNSDCSKCSFLASDLSYSVFRATMLNDVYMSESTWNNVDFSFALLRNITAKNSSFTATKYIQSDLSNADFSESNLSGAIFHQAKLGGVNFSNSNLQNTKFIQVNVSRVMFNGADIKGADFSLARGMNGDTFKDSINAELAILPIKKEGANEY